MTKTYIGIDISKATFEASLTINNKVIGRIFTNDDKGYRRFCDWLQYLKLEEVYNCMEATGFYGDGLAEYLFLNGYNISVVNPCCIKSFAKSKLKRHKTDKIDASIIAEYAEKLQPPLWKLPEANKQELKELNRCVEALKFQLQQVKNQLENKNKKSTLVTETWKALKSQITNEIKAVYERMEQLINSHSELKQDYENLLTISGVNKITAIGLLAEIPDLSSFKNARQLAAYAGLIPKHRYSGTTVQGKPRLSKVGSSHFRKILYFPAIVAKQFNPTIRIFCENLKNKGKATMSIIGAAMRKLLHMVFAILKYKTCFKTIYSNS
jgi:transposase